MCYDSTNMESFKSVKTWLDDIERCARENVNVLLIGTKKDLADKVVVSTDAARELAEYRGISFIECSAKSGVGVNEVFETMVEEVLERVLTELGEPY